MIQVKGITKSFGKLQVLRGVDLEVRESEVLAIVGASGAGKSTLLQIIGTLLRPDSGTISISGAEPFSFNDRKLSAFRNRHIGFVFQSNNLLPEFSAVENVMIPLLIAGESRSRAIDKSLSLLDRVGLSLRASHKPSELSGGEQQRVAIARAIACNPDILLADEPSGNLDSATKEQIHNLFFELRDATGQTTVIVTHDNSLAAMCDRSLTMKDGLILPL